MKGGGDNSRHYTRPISNSETYSSSNYSEDKCDTVNFKTLLLNIQPVVINHSAGDILEVQLDSAENVIVTGKFGICGNITSLESLLVVECLKKGKLFKAVIISVSSTSCEVTVRPLRK